jgi:hypothetical protein
MCINFSLIFIFLEISCLCKINSTQLGLATEGEDDAQIHDFRSRDHGVCSFAGIGSGHG